MISLFIVILYPPTFLQISLIHQQFSTSVTKWKYREMDSSMASSEKVEGVDSKNLRPEDLARSPTTSNTNHTFHDTPSNYDYLDGRSFNYSEASNIIPQASSNSFNHQIVSNDYSMLSKLMLLGTSNSYRKNPWS